MSQREAPLILFLQTNNYIHAAKAVEIAIHFTPIEWKKNEWLLRERQVSDQYIFINTGCIRTFVHDVNGLEVTTGFHMQHQVVFEVSSFFNRTPSKENMQALSDGDGWCLSFEQLNKLFHTLPEFREFGRSLLVRGFSSFKNRTLSMITETAEERYAGLLQSNPAIFQYASLKQIASFLGITDSSLSRIRKQLSHK